MMNRRLLKAAECAEILAVGRSTLWRLHAAGKLPRPLRIGGATRWRGEEIKGWIGAGCPSRDRWEAMRENVMTR